MFRSAKKPYNMTYDKEKKLIVTKLQMSQIELTNKDFNVK